MVPLSAELSITRITADGVQHETNRFHRDSAGPVPFVGYIAFANIAFAAASTGDATVVDSLVVVQFF